MLRFLIYFSAVLLISCNSGKGIQVDAIYFNGNIITMDDSLPSASVLIIDNGKILEVGDSTLLAKYNCNAGACVDLKKQFVYPGLIDAHCHFYGYAKTLLSCNLVGTKSWEAVLSLLDSFGKTNASGWLTGRGWDQNDWADKNYPSNEKLNLLFPDRPVILKRIDGHAAICNQKALELAHIDGHTQLNGGEIILSAGKPTGVLVDNAVDLVEKIVTLPSDKDLIRVLKQAEKECFDLGLTTLADAGLDIETCLFIDSLEKNKVLNMFFYLMLNPTENGLRFAQTKGVYENDAVKICSFKLYGDGAMGSRGARMKQPYCDRKDHSGMLLNDPEYFDKWCSDIKTTTTYQVNTHCIGDSAIKLLLETYGRYLKGKNDLRWRIEHAQIVDPNDFNLFEQYNIIPSVQPTHATSDGPWIEDRICSNRLEGAYAYKTLLGLNNYLPLGTDFPVEYLNPLYTFYSAVFRQNANESGQAPFREEERLTNLQALKGMTIWAAKACRLEKRKGSIASGKDADFIIMDTNLLTAGKADVLKSKVTKTFRNGKAVN